ncbi:probable ATP-dependent RNA helicase DDX23 [Saccostrea echinata]|uniref:probable ATP-dependent RNA helicase DDX23 n=1 Tax=Saccostrea echinata TaxID=191078 RepID=UPI002A83EE16|nr:probable ATP-dependent RNA helicase DDX23 [Saccostrea echinata]
MSDFKKKPSRTNIDPSTNRRNPPTSRRDQPTNRRDPPTNKRDPTMTKKEKTGRDGKRSVSLPPLKTERSTRKANRVPEWNKRPWSLEPSRDIYKTEQSRSTRDKKSNFKPHTTSQKDLWSIYNAKPRFPTPYRPDSSLSMKSNFSRPSSRSSSIQKWHKDTEAAYDTVSQRSLRFDKHVKKLASVTTKFDRDAERARKERERKNKEERERVLKNLKERRRDFAERNYKRVHQQFVSPKVLEHERDERNTYGLPKYLLFDVKYPKSKSKQDDSKSQSPRLQKHSQLPASTKFALKTDKKTQQQKNSSTNKSGDFRSASRQRDYQELYKIYCIPGNSRLRDWAKEENAALAIAFNRRPRHTEKPRSSTLPSLRMNIYKSPYVNNSKPQRLVPVH